MNQRRTVVIVVLFAALIGIVILWTSLTFTIQAGERGIIFRKFQGGLDTETVYEQGFHIKFP